MVCFDPPYNVFAVVVKQSHLAEWLTLLLEEGDSPLLMARHKCYGKNNLVSGQAHEMWKSQLHERKIRSEVILSDEKRVLSQILVLSVTALKAFTAEGFNAVSYPRNVSSGRSGP